MTRDLIAYAAQTLHVAAAVIRHIADGADLIGHTLNPTRTATIVAGATRNEWCDTCRVHHPTATIYAHDGDPTAAFPIGEWFDCDHDEDDDD